MLLFFFFNDTATTEIYTLSLHDALPICVVGPLNRQPPPLSAPRARPGESRSANCPERHRASASGSDAGRRKGRARDRKSTRLNSSHDQISYAVFCLKKKKKTRLS